MVKPIEMKTLADARRINELATACPFDVYVESKSLRVDAKSMLGLLILLNRPELTLVAPDEADAKVFARLANKVSAKV